LKSGIRESSIDLLNPRFADGILLVVLAILTIFLPGLIPAGTAGDMIVVRTADSVYEISLMEEGSYVVKGYLGDAVLVVKDGEATLNNAPCPLKICEAMAPASRAGEVILCLPNRISVRVAGPEEVDAVSR